MLFKTASVLAAAVGVLSQQHEWKVSAPLGTNPGLVKALFFNFDETINAQNIITGFLALPVCGGAAVCQNYSIPLELANTSCPCLGNYTAGQYNSSVLSDLWSAQNATTKSAQVSGNLTGFGLKPRIDMLLALLALAKANKVPTYIVSTSWSYIDPNNWQNMIYTWLGSMSAEFAGGEELFAKDNIFTLGTPGAGFPTNPNKGAVIQPIMKSLGLSTSQALFMGCSDQNIADVTGICDWLWVQPALGGLTPEMVGYVSARLTGSPSSGAGNVAAILLAVLSSMLAALTL
jgi:hypothetical protein